MTALATAPVEVASPRAHWSPGDTRRLGVTGAIVAALLTALHTCTTSKQFVDLQVYRMGASSLLHGASPYDSVLPTGSLPYTYTPFSTIVFTPLAAMPLRIAVVAHTFVSLIALVATVFLALRAVSGPALVPRRLIAGTALATIALYWSEPVLQTLGFGQINLVLMALVVVDLLALRRTRWAGVLIGIAAGIKLTPLVFVLYLAGLRRYRAACTAATTAAATVLLGWLFLPHATTRFFTKLAFDPRRIGDPGFVANQSLGGMLTRITGSYVTAHPYWQVGALVLLALGVHTAVEGHKRWGEPIGLGLCALTGLLVSPISWSHHWVWWGVAAVVVAWRAYERWTPTALAVAVGLALPFYIGPFWRLDPKNFRGLSPVGWQRPVGEAYFLVGLATLLAATAWLRWSKARDGSVHRCPAVDPSGDGVDRDGLPVG